MASNRSIACIACNGKKVLVAHRLPEGDMGGRWEFPGGKAEAGESDEEAAKREMQEEFGVGVTVGKRIAESRFTHRGEERVLIAYSVKFPPDMDTEHLSLTEHSECKWADLNEIEKLNFVDSDMKIYPAVKRAAAEGNV